MKVRSKDEKECKEQLGDVPLLHIRKVPERWRGGQVGGEGWRGRDRAWVRWRRSSLERKLKAVQEIVNVVQTFHQERIVQVAKVIPPERFLERMVEETAEDIVNLEQIFFQGRIVQDGFRKNVSLIV